MGAYTNINNEVRSVFTHHITTQRLTFTINYSTLKSVNNISITRINNMASSSDAPSTDAILQQPSVEERIEQSKIPIEHVPFSSFDPGAFHVSLIKQGLYMKRDTNRFLSRAPVNEQGITKGTYSGTQAALAHGYSLIEERYGIFDTC